MKNQLTSDLNWIPITVAGESGQQTFFHIDGVRCRAVYIPARKNLYLTVEVKGKVSENAIIPVREAIKDPIEIVNGEKLLIKYEMEQDYSDAALRVLIVIVKTLLTIHNSGVT